MNEELKTAFKKLSAVARWLFIGIWGPSIFSYRSSKFRHLLSEYYVSGGTENENSPSEIGRMIKAYKANEYIGWDDLCLLEIAIIKQLKKSNLVLKEQHLRVQFRSITDTDRYLAYEQAVAELGDNNPGDDVLREQAIYLTHQLYWTYAVATKGHKIRSRASLLVTYVFVAILAHLLAISGPGANNPDPANPYSAYFLVFSVICFGAFGAYISFQRRMAVLRIQSEMYMAFLQLRSSYFDGLAALFSGALFALLFVVLWESETLKLLFNAQILDSVLPKVTKDPERECTHTITGFFACLQMDSLQDFSKLLVMSFFAGFAEKLVPDAIDRFVGKAKPKA